MNGRVKYYSSNDLMYGHNLSKIETLQIPAADKIDINDAIEFFQIEKYFDGGTRAKTWSDEDYNEYKEKCNSLSKLTKQFFNQINDDNIIDYYNIIEHGYHSDFWTLFDNCKLFNKITNEVFERLITDKKASPQDLLLHKNIVRKYGQVLRTFIMHNNDCINTILQVYEQMYDKDSGRREKLTLPVELTGEDICNYLGSYIDGERPNINVLSDIINMRSAKSFPITDEIRLKAKSRYELESERIATSSNGLNLGVQVLFNPMQKEERIISQSGCEQSISYSTKWLLETLDYPSILNNFIYIFDFVDVPQMRSAHVNKNSLSGIFERVFSQKSSKIYPHNVAFDFTEIIASMQMEAYYDFLIKQNIYLEDVLKWFFTEEIQSEFGCSEIRLSVPSHGSSYAEKCTLIITAFESVLRQYSLYAQNGKINFDLIGMSSTPVRFSDVKSIIADKHIYGVGKEFEHLSFWLFSDQCTFSYVERIHKNGAMYTCLYDLLLNETVYTSDYCDEELPAFEHIASFDLILIDADGKISLNDKVKLGILRDLFKNDVISQWHYSSYARECITDWLKMGILRSESSLFSKPEVDYLNYLLNRADYNNGLEIRNKYIHGIQQVNLSEDEHRKNYLTLLRLFVLLAIKVNDEFCIKYDIMEKERMETEAAETAQSTTRINGCAGIKTSG